MKDKKLYAEILNLPFPWEVASVELDKEKEEIYITISYNSHKGKCSECDEECSLYDHRERREWRHLDTCQFKTYLIL